MIRAHATTNARTRRRPPATQDKRAMSPISLRMGLTSMTAVLMLLLQACGASLQAAPLPAPAVDAARPSAAGTLQTAVFAGGCFWGVEAVYRHVKGVKAAVSGYAGGDAKTADYETVSSGNTGHAESVQVTFDPTQVTYGELLRIFFSVAHDPTQLNRQGPDVATQYRSVVFDATD